MTPNWFLDGEHVLTLAGGTLIFTTQCLNWWRQNVAGERIKALHRIVADNDAEILSELSAAQRALDSVVAMVSGSRDRRKTPPGAPPPGWANGGAGRRATDAAPG